MSLFYSEKYVTTDGVAVFRIYTLILLFKSIYWGIFLNALGKTKFILYTSILTLIFNFIGNIAFYHLIGFIGPAISSLLVIGIMAFVQLRFTGHLLNVPIKKILPWKNFIVNIFQTLIIGVIFAVLKYRIFDCNNRNISITISISMGVVWAVIYGLINLNSLKESWKKLNS
nr:oligosaccharide flippase family protein [Dorea phocaeensis]